MGSKAEGIIVLDIGLKVQMGPKAEGIIVLGGLR